MMEPNEQEVMGQEEAAKYMCLSPDTLSTWRRERRGPIFIRAGGRVLYFKADILNYLREQRVDPASVPRRKKEPDAVQAG